MSFRTLLKRLQKHYPTTKAFARALDIDPSHLSRAMSAHGQPFDVRGCLRLAQVTGADAGEVLRAAGKAEIAALIEGLYGIAQPTLNPDQQQLIAALDAIMDPAVRQSLITVARSAAGLPGGKSGTNSGGSGPVGGNLIPPPKEPDYKMRERFGRRAGTAR